jgi:hypothetical protein
MRFVKVICFASQSRTDIENFSCTLYAKIQEKVPILSIELWRSKSLSTKLTIQSQQFVTCHQNKNPSVHYTPILTHNSSDLQV